MMILCHLAEANDQVMMNLADAAGREIHIPGGIPASENQVVVS